jgi:large repetitive protein
MKTHILLFVTWLFPITLLGQSNRVFFESTVSLAWQTTDVKNLSQYGLGIGLGYSFHNDLAYRFGFDVKFRYHEACWHGQDYTQTSLDFLPGNYVGALAEYKDELGFTVNNFANDAQEYGLEFAVHLNRLRENHNIDPYIFGGLSLVKNQAKGDLIRYVGEPAIYRYDHFDMNKETRTAYLDGTYESPLDGSIYGTRIQLMPGLGVGCVYHFNRIFSLGLEHKTIFTLRDDFDGFQPIVDRGERINKDLFHYSGVVVRFQFAKRRR